MQRYSHSKSNLLQLFQGVVAFLFVATVVAMGEEPIESGTIEDAIGECCSYNPFQYSRLEIGYSWGDFIGISKDYAELGVFLPVLLSKEGVVFVDARGYHFSNSHWGSSTGIGVRRVICNGDVLGVNVYYDNFEGQQDSFFNRLSIGLEYLNPCWDFRVNGYFPVGAKNHGSAISVFRYPGGFVSTCQIIEFPVNNKGFDAEIGFPLFCCCDFRIYGAIGPYYYDGNENDDIWGGFGRLEVYLNEYISFRVRSSYDKTFHSRTQVSVFLDLPFDLLCCFKCCKDCCLRLLTDPVRRNGLMFTDDCCNWTQNW
jgi:hypothetical protein